MFQTCLGAEASPSPPSPCHWAGWAQSGLHFSFPKAELKWESRKKAAHFIYRSFASRHLRVMLTGNPIPCILTYYQKKFYLCSFLHTRQHLYHPFIKASLYQLQDRWRWLIIINTSFQLQLLTILLIDMPRVMLHNKSYVASILFYDYSITYSSCTSHSPFSYQDWCNSFQWHFLRPWCTCRSQFSWSIERFVCRNS